MELCRTHDFAAGGVCGLGNALNALLRSIRFARRTNLGRLNDTLSRVSMRQLHHPSVLPILQHARDLTTVVVTTQRCRCFTFAESVRRAIRKLTAIFGAAPGKARMPLHCVCFDGKQTIKGTSVFS